MRARRMQGVALVSGLGLAACSSAVAHEAGAARKKLEDCHLLGAGAANLEQLESEPCEANCYLGASCSELQTLLCSDGTGAPAFGLIECLKECWGALKCEGFGGAITTAVVCDGFRQCAGGEDEEGCSNVVEIDGRPYCEDASDEGDCRPAFQCESGTRVAAENECDLDSDCPDGSDEHAGCAELVCPGAMSAWR